MKSYSGRHGELSGLLVPLAITFLSLLLCMILAKYYTDVFDIRTTNHTSTKIGYENRLRYAMFDLYKGNNAPCAAIDLAFIRQSMSEIGLKGDCKSQSSSPPVYCRGLQSRQEQLRGHISAWR